MARESVDDNYIVLDIDSLSEASTGPDAADAQLDLQKDFMTSEDRDLAHIDEHNALLCDIHIWPADPQYRTISYIDVHSGVLASCTLCIQ